jgi:hypothetical protein
MKPTEIQNRLGGSPAGAGGFPLCALALAAILMMGGVVAGFGQAPAAPPEPAKPAEQAKPAEKATDNKQPPPPAENAGKTIGGYLVHQEIELGGRIVVDKTGSEPMWATMVNQVSGFRVLNQFIDMHSLNPSKTPIFDTLTSSSFGYGGDPYDVSRLNFSKGRWYAFAGSFRRDRQYFDYNLLVNSLLTTFTPTQPVLVPEPNSLHPFNTVRRNTDVLVTILPLSIVSFRAGYNLGTHEGPTLSTYHGGGDVQLNQWFRNSLDSYIGGVDFKVAKRTTLSYDQFYTFYKGDSSNQLYGANYVLANGSPVSLGVNVLGGTTTCGSKAGNNTPSTIGTWIENGIVNPYCSLTITQNEVSPTRTSFPVEQLRFSSHYWDKITFNGRYLYSGGTTNINSFNETFNGFSSRTDVRQTIETGAGRNGKFADNKRINNNGDFGVEAELTKNISVSDVFNYWNMRTSGSSIYNVQTWTGTNGSITPPVPATSALTPLNDPTITVTAPTTIATAFLNHKNIGNTVLGTVIVIPQFKFTAGWRFNNRNITDPGDDLTWHQNWLLLGGVVQPSRAFRLNVNYDLMDSNSANSSTPANTFTREAPNKIYQTLIRASVIPTKWLNLSLTFNDYEARNNDPLVNHSAHNRGFSFGTQIIPMETLSVDISYGYDSSYSVTDLCYAFTPNPNAPLPTGAVNAGTCTTGNSPNGSSSLYLGNGYYNVPANYFYGAINYAPGKYVRLLGGANYNHLGGSAEQLNPLMVPGAISSEGVSPFADVQVNVAKQWIWHGNWTHESYQEADGPGPAARSFHGELLTLGVRWTF